MLARQIRERRELVYKRSRELRDATRAEKKRKIKATLSADANTEKLPGELTTEAAELAENLDWAEGVAQDDEYRWAGAEQPRLVITTSRDPSAKLKQFAKELRFLFPGAMRINRGGYQLDELTRSCRANGVTDMILVSETRGIPDGLIVSHLPHGPTAFFQLSAVLLRHDMPDVGHMPQEQANVILEGFSSVVGKRVAQVLRHLFPVCLKAQSRRVCTFAVIDDLIVFRQHTWRWQGKETELTEHGPRFSMQLYRILQGPLDERETADNEYVYRPYMNTTHKRKFLTD